MSSSSRLKLVDSVKGMAIVLVVYGHVAQGVHHRGWWDSPNYAFQETFIYSFHMAAFFFVSGLFVERSIAKASSGQFVLQKIRTVLWPYLTCALSGAAEAVFGQKGENHDILHRVLIPAVTGEASWFLPTLFLCLMLALATDRLPAWARFALALGLNLMWPANGIWSIIDRTAKFFVFLAAGEWVHSNIEYLERVPRWRLIGSSVVLFGLVAAGCFSSLSGIRGMGVLLGFGGILGLFCLAGGLRFSVFESAAVWCGVASLGIFVLHPFIQGGTRVVLARLTTSHAVLLNLLVPCIVAILGSGLLWHFRERLRIGFVFECPWGAPQGRTSSGNSAANSSALDASRGNSK